MLQQTSEDKHLHYLVNLLFFFVLKRVHIDVEIVQWVMRVMVKHARQVVSCQINNVLITVSVMETPSVFGIQTVLQCACAKLASLEMVLVKTVAFQVTWMLARLFVVEMVELV